MPEELDQLEAFEAKETKHRLPLGWVLLFWGLVVWGVYYLWAYTPALSGWSQAKALEAPDTSAGLNLFAALIFTTVAAVAAIAILLTLRARSGRIGPGAEKRP